VFGLASPRDVLQSLYQLRWIAVAGQLTAILLAWKGLNLSIPVMPLLFGVTLLGVFNFGVWARLKKFSSPPIVPEVFGHMLVDVGVLSYLLALTGGYTNPYFTLHLVPIAIAAVSLPLPWVIAVGIVTFACATLTVFIHLPLPFEIADPDSTLNRLAGWTSFTLCLFLLLIFVVSLARRSRQQTLAMQSLRERAMRNESVVALASQAASVAHELNTPLSTVATVVADLKYEYANDEELGPDLHLIDEQLKLCRDYIKEMVELSRADSIPKPQLVSRVVDAAVSQFRLLHPMVKLDVALPDELEPERRDAQILADRSVIHLVVGLLNNAADASRAAGSQEIVLTWTVRNGRLRIDVRDFGTGLTATQRDLAGAFGFSTKANGLGLGLSLGQLTTERFEGNLSLREADGAGTVAVAELPLVN
jgi:two-component system, sensor histidine kinase RegB